MQEIKLSKIIGLDPSSKTQSLSNTIPKHIGKGFLQNIHLSDGFSLLKTDFSFLKPHKIQSAQNTRKLVITISLEGGGVYKNHDDKSVFFKKGYTTITSFDKTDGTTYLEDNRLSQIRLILEADFLEKNFSKHLLERYGYYNQNSLNLLDFSPCSQDSLIAIKQIANTKDDPLSAFYFRSKALELVFFELSKIDKARINIALDSYDTKAIHKAKEMLLQDLQDPPSIADLAKLSHINEFKLKKGFKQVFGKTPYELLRQKRMHEAKDLLLSGASIKETSKLVGYSFASNFSNAFSKELGITPKMISKQTKFY